MARKVADLNVAPPTQAQTQSVLQYLRNAVYLEHACVLAGIPVSLLEKWIVLGRRGKPGFVEFVGAIDRANADLGNMVSNTFMDLARQGDTKALAWVHDKRLAQREKHRTARILELEDKILDEIIENPTDEDLAAAERRLTELLGADTVH
jgi:hypothetical protein